MAKVTMQDIADELGVSRISVWKVFNRRKEVSTALADRVLDKAVAMGYGKALRIEEERMKNRSRIALAMNCEEASLASSEFLKGFSDCIAHEDASLLFFNLPSSVDEQYVLPEALRRGNADVVVAVGISSLRQAMLIAELATPAVFFDLPDGFPPELASFDLYLPECRSSSIAAAAMMVRSGGIRHPVFVVDRPSLASTLLADAFRDAFSGEGIAMESMGVSDFLSSVPDCDAAIFGSDASLAAARESMEAKSDLPLFFCAASSSADASYPSLYLDPASLGREIALRAMRRLRDRETFFSVVSIRPSMRKGCLP